MYRITNDLMGRSSKTLFPKSDDGPGALADCFVTHFTDKITDIRVHLATISTQRQLSVVADDNDCRVVDPLCDFELATCNDICNLVMKGTSKLSTDIDIISATLLKSNIATLAPVLTRIVNLSIESSTMPAVMKHAVMTPLLKKSDLDREILSNYRPISNLSFISKLVEKYVASQIRQYMESNDLFNVFQSAYRPAHSCETGLGRIQVYILHSLDNRNTVILVLLDLSAAFDTVDHRLLLDKLHEIGLRDAAHRWIQSYLSQRTQTVKVDNVTSRSVDLCFGVPQGSVLGPLFFTSYCLKLNHVFEHHQLRYHMYADDTRLYVEFPRDQPVHATTAIDRISRCTADVKSRMVSHNLLLNECKTETVVISAAQNRKCVQPPVDLVIDVCGCSVTPKPFIRDIGFVFDDTMTMAAQIRRVCQVAYCHIRGIAAIRKCLSTTACKTIIHALVMSHLDFGNAMLLTQLRKLQMIQNSAARMITETRRRDHITPVLFSLHWLPVRQRIEFKLLLLVFRAVHHLCPVYLSSLVIPYTPTRTLRSADQHLLTIPRYHLERYGRRAFSVAGPTLWNALPPAIRRANSVAVFKSLLKTHLFREAFSTLC